MYSEIDYKNCTTELTAKPAIGDFYQVENGVSNTDLRETFGYCGKHLSMESTSMFLFPEECLYAHDRGLLSNRIATSIPHELEFFYTHMRNKGQFLTRRLALESVEPPPAKRQKVEPSLTASSSTKFIEYDCYPSRNSFNKKEIVEWGRENP